MSGKARGGSRRHWSALAIGLGAGLVVAAVWWLGLLRTYELALYDLRMRMRGEAAGESPDMVILAVDDGTLDTMSAVWRSWPWARDAQGLLAKWAFRHGAECVAFDIIFAEGQAYEPEQDAAFAEVIAGTGPVYLASALQQERARVYRASERAGARERLANRYQAGSAQAQRFLAKFAFYREHFALDPARIDTRDGDALDSLDALLPALLFMQPADGVGFTVIPPDVDGKNRRVPLVMQYDGNYYPSLHVLLACHRLGVDFHRIEVVFGKYLTIPGAPGGDVRVPIDRQGGILLDYYDAEVKRYFRAMSVSDFFLAAGTLATAERLQIDLHRLREPAYVKEVGPRLQAEDVTPEDITAAAGLLAELRGRIALFGVTATASTDIRPMPLAGAYPMVGTVATAVQNILDRRFLRRVPAAVDLAAIVAMGLLVGALGVALRGSRYSVLVLAALALYAAGAYWLFAYDSRWVDLLHPLVSGGIAYVGAALVAYVGEQREKAAIKGVFSRIVNKEVMEELIADPEALALGGASREVTILFTDIKGFTSLSEAMPPAGVVELLNEYFTEMVEIVFKHGGMLDKYIGDAMMLVFGVPRPYGSQDEAPRRAVRCAVEMQKQMRQLQQSYKDRNLPLLRMRIGVNTGEVVAGNIGSIKRLEYSVIGDAVNLASRLESNAPVDGVLISQYTYRYVADEVIAQKKPPLVVKGRQQPVDVYEILDVKEPSHEAVSRGA